LKETFINLERILKRLDVQHLLDVEQLY